MSTVQWTLSKNGLGYKHVQGERKMYSFQIPHASSLHIPTPKPETPLSCEWSSSTVIKLIDQWMPLHDFFQCHATETSLKFIFIHFLWCLLCLIQSLSNSTIQTSWSILGYFRITSWGHMYTFGDQNDFNGGRLLKTDLLKHLIQLGFGKKQLFF